MSEKMDVFVSSLCEGGVNGSNLRYKFTGGCIEGSMIISIVFIVGTSLQKDLSSPFHDPLEPIFQ